MLKRPPSTDDWLWRGVVLAIGGLVIAVGLWTCTLAVRAEHIPAWDGRAGKHWWFTDGR